METPSEASEAHNFVTYRITYNIDIKISYMPHLQDILCQRTIYPLYSLLSYSPTSITTILYSEGQKNAFSVTLQMGSFERKPQACIKQTVYNFNDLCSQPRDCSYTFYYEIQRVEKIILKNKIPIYQL